MTENNAIWVSLLGWAGILVPVVLLFVMALIRSIIKRNDFFSGENLYLGVDLCFAGLAAALVQATELLRQHFEKPSESQFSQLIIVLALAFGNGIALLVVTKLHQKWDTECPKTSVVGRVAAERDQKRLARNHGLKQIFWLGIASNGVGFTTILMFVWLRAEKIV